MVTFASEPTNDEQIPAYHARLDSEGFTFTLNDKVFIKRDTTATYSTFMNKAKVTIPEFPSDLLQRIDSTTMGGTQYKFIKDCIGIIATDSDQYNIGVSVYKGAPAITIEYHKLGKIVPKDLKRTPPKRCAILGGKRRQTRKRSRKSKRRARR